MNTLSLLLQPASTVLTSGRIASKTTDFSTAQPGVFELKMEKIAEPGPANFAAPAGSATAATLYAAQDIAQSEATSPTKSAEDRFLELMDKSPEELMREQILKELGYTEEQLAGMSPEDRLKAEEEIRQLILEKIEQAMREKGLDAPLGKVPLTQSLAG